ncbi:integrase [Labrys miyagiensis]|uniref:Integrase n=1 Tax=Labrys miyagiensis TaxID=346912 RepID=A0ABQ6CQB0_9HYPH|nr:site-specific integrase [Labrys miyagiensis]GLS21968.1 integrase [Labrys miyagiensis]
MARQVDRLNARSITALSTQGRHADGGGLYLIVDHNGAKRWSFIFRWQGKLKEMGLGGLSSVSLARARDLAKEARARVADGVNPIEERKRDKPVPTFGAMTKIYIDSHSASWKNTKHRQQWENTLAQHAKLLTDKPVDQIDVAEVLKVLQPIWSKIPETASRVRGRMEAILDAAKVSGHRTGENPATWKGNLKHLLSSRKRLTRGHHAALPFAELPAFMERLRARPGASATQLEFLILNASRSSEVRLASWSEIEFDEKLWIIPAERMKMAREHRLPLSPRSMEILTAIRERQQTESQVIGRQWSEKGHIFTQPGGTTAPSINATEMLLRRMKANVTTHGFRSSFRDWVGDATNFDRDLAEMQLAHQVGDETEIAYRRSDALQKRRKLMEAWASYLTSDDGSKVGQMKRN